MVSLYLAAFLLLYVWLMLVTEPLAVTITHDYLAGSIRGPRLRINTSYDTNEPVKGAKA